LNRATGRSLNPTITLSINGGISCVIAGIRAFIVQSPPQSNKRHGARKAFLCALAGVV
jgi:hypothetical protein